MEKQQILTAQAALVRQEAVEKQLALIREELNGLNKRLKGSIPLVRNKWLLPLVSIASLAMGLLAGMAL